MSFDSLVEEIFRELRRTGFDRDEMPEVAETGDAEFERLRQRLSETVRQIQDERDNPGPQFFSV